MKRLALSLVLCAAATAGPGDIEGAGVRIERLAITRIDPQHETLGRIGGISGLSWIGDDRYIAVSDRSPEAQALTMHVNVSLEGGSWACDVSEIAEHALDHPAHDAEGVTRLPDGGIAVAYESPPTLARFDEAGVEIMELPDEVSRHARSNASLESICIVPRGRSWEIWTATEAALRTDGPRATTSQGTRCRVIVDGGAQQFTYITDPAPRALVGSGVRSLSEMTTLSDGRILTLERSATFPGGYGGRLFVIDGATTDEPDAAYPVLKKDLVGELSELVGVFGNIEAVAIGPAMAELTGDESQQGRLLLLMSDDNFGRDMQDGTQVVACRLIIDDE